MDYLDDVLSYLTSGSYQKSYSSHVQKQVHKMRGHLSELQVQFVFEKIGEVNEAKKKFASTTKFTYRGNFYYGYIKGGVFHEYAGDVSTRVEKVPIEGEVEVEVDNQSGEIVSIHESIGGERFGSVNRTSLRTKLALLFGVMLAVYFIVFRFSPNAVSPVRTVLYSIVVAYLCVYLYSKIKKIFFK